MTKGLARLASHNSNMVASLEQTYEGGWTVYRTKRWQRAEKLAKRNTQSFFDYDSEDFSYHNPFLASSTTSSISTGTKILYADIVKRTGHNSQPPMKMKTKTSDEERICSEITQDPFLLKCTKSMITDPPVHRGNSVPNRNMKL